MSGGVAAKRVGIVALVAAVGTGGYACYKRQV